MVPYGQWTAAYENISYLHHLYTLDCSEFSRNENHTAMYFIQYQAMCGVGDFT